MERRKPVVNSTLTAIILENKETGQFSAYIEEIPEVVAQGNKDDIMENLETALAFVLDYRRSKSHHGDGHSQEILNDDLIRSSRSLQIEFA